VLLKQIFEFPVHSFVFEEDSDMTRSNRGSGADLEATYVQDYASSVDTRSVAESDVLEYDVEGLQLFSLAELQFLTSQQDWCWKVWCCVHRQTR